MDIQLLFWVDHLHSFLILWRTHCIWILVHVSGIPCVLHYLDDFFNSVLTKGLC